MKLKNALGDRMPADCIFCQIAHKEELSPIKYEDESFVIIPSKFPAAETHFLVIPKEHIKSIADVQSENQQLLGVMLLVASKFAKKQDIVDYKLIFNVGKYAQIPHLHLHLLSGDLKDNT
ncbi:MAG: histidine triad protein [Candidatus Doudnabacteria bacterium]|nr:histidine triad protein [Candidatus Doudnabacteria bacterium]